MLRQIRFKRFQLICFSVWLQNFLKKSGKVREFDLKKSGKVRKFDTIFSVETLMFCYYLAENGAKKIFVCFKISLSVTALTISLNRPVCQQKRQKSFVDSQLLKIQVGVRLQKQKLFLHQECRNYKISSQGICFCFSEGFFD